MGSVVINQKSQDGSKLSIENDLLSTDVAAVEQPGFLESEDAHKIDHHARPQDPSTSIFLDQANLSPNKLSQIAIIQPPNSAPYYNRLEKDPSTGIQYILYQEVDQVIASVRWMVVNQYVMVEMEDERYFAVWKQDQKPSILLRLASKTLPSHIGLRFNKPFAKKKPCNNHRGR